MISDPVWRALARPSKYDMHQLLKDLSYFHHWEAERVELVLDYYSWTKQELQKDELPQ